MPTELWHTGAGWHPRSRGEPRTPRLQLRPQPPLWRTPQGRAGRGETHEPGGRGGACGWPQREPRGRLSPRTGAPVQSRSLGGVARPSRVPAWSHPEVPGSTHRGRPWSPAPPSLGPWEDAPIWREARLGLGPRVEQRAASGSFKKYQGQFFQDSTIYKGPFRSSFYLLHGHHPLANFTNRGAQFG